MNTIFGVAGNETGSFLGGFPPPTFPDLIPMLQQRRIKRGPQPLVLTGTLPTSEYHWLTSSSGASTFDSVIVSPWSFESYPKPTQPKPSEFVGVALSSTTFGEQHDLLFEITKSFLQMLADEYVSGARDIPEIARQLGKPWTENDVVLLLELLGAHRTNSSSTLPREEKEKILNKLAKIRSTPEANEFDNSNWIQREVIASERIESVYVSPEDLQDMQT